MTQTSARCQALACMPTIDNAKLELFIKAIEGQAVSWTTFWNPFFDDIWLMMVVVAMIIACALTFIEKLYALTNQSFCLTNYVKNFWVALKVNLELALEKLSNFLE